MRDKILENRCSELGRLATSKACKSHVPDAFSLLQDNEPRLMSLVDMGAVFRRMSPNDMQILAAILMNDRKTRRVGFHFMQKVYIRIAGAAGRNYMSNFAMGYIIDANRESIRAMSETAHTAVVMPNEKNSQSIYTIQQFAAIRDEIVVKKQYVDPEVIIGRSRISSQAIIDLDRADAQGLLESAGAQRRKIKKVKQKDDLVSFVAKLSRGVIKTRKAEAMHDEEISVNW